MIREQTVTEWIRDSCTRRQMTIDEAEDRARMSTSAGWSRGLWSRCVIGALRYERLGVGHYDAHGGILDRILDYRATGNTELLLDIANLARIEYHRPVHPLAHFSAGDDTTHCEELP